MKRTVLFGGNETTLAGTAVSVGDKAPNFQTLKGDNTPFELKDVAGKVVVVTVFPSVDTSVCAAQTRMFNKRATELSEDVVIVTVSNDLPFALSRFCAAEGINNVITTSDHRTLDFALQYGYLLEEFRLLERGTVVIDQEGTIAYVEYCAEVTDEPNYDASLDVVRELLNK